MSSTFRCTRDRLWLSPACTIPFRSTNRAGFAMVVASLALLNAAGCANLDRFTSAVTKPASNPAQVAARTKAQDTARAVALDTSSPQALPAWEPTVALTSASELLVQEVASEPTIASAYSLADVEALASQNNPALAMAAATVTKASGLRYQVGLRPNPTMGYFGQQIADRGTDQHGVFVEQEFVRGNKLQLNREVLSHTRRAQVAEAEAQMYRVLTDVRVRFYEALAAQQQADVTRGFAEAARQGVVVAKDRQRAEEGSRIETLQAETLLSEVTLTAEQAEAAYRGAWQDLAAVAGIDGTSPVRLVADWQSLQRPTDWSVVYEEIKTQSPELVVAQALVCEKQAILRRQQAQPIPNVTTQLGAGYDDGTDHGMLNLQLAAPIPTFNQNNGNVSAAYQDYVRAVQNVQRIEQSLQSRLARTTQDFESAWQAVRRYEDEIMPQTKQALELSESAYRAGELDFLQVLIIRRSYFESSVRLIQAQGNLAQAAARVDGLLLTGGLEMPADYTDGDTLRGASLGGQ